ncbi:MAG: NACHT domain-containing protein [Blastochloris sp.]|nr:NACHT domain-containing protein [Blastochloris sp.]
MDELRIILFYGGAAATQPREALLTWLRSDTVADYLQRSVEARKVSDWPAHSGATVDARVSEAITWADKAIVLVTPDARGDHGAPNVLEEMGRWREKKGGESLVILRHRHVPVHSNQAGVIYIGYDDHATMVDECHERLLAFLQQSPSPQTTKGGPFRSYTRRDMHDRTRTIRRVHRYWIRDRWEQAHHTAPLIPLRLEQHDQAVVHPWSDLVQERVAVPHMLPANTSIVHVFDDCDGDLLILGAPGSGKTMLLLTLTRELLRRAEADLAHLIPIVLNLSSWSSARGSLAEWVITELHNRYYVPHTTAEYWVHHDQLILLLDGLDEVVLNQRDACITVINTFRKEHGMVPLVVCSRISDYEAVPSRLSLDRAIVVQPLTQAQIHTYLTSVEAPLTGLQEALQVDADLRELAERPLFLSVMALAYQGSPAHTLPLGETQDVQRERIFAQYINTMFERRNVTSRYTRAQTLRWLTWLAQNMQREGQSLFLIEDLQPNWLPPSLRCAYVFLDRFGIGLTIGILHGLVYAGLTGVVSDFSLFWLNFFSIAPIVSLMVILSSDTTNTAASLTIYHTMLKSLGGGVLLVSMSLLTHALVTPLGLSVFLTGPNPFLLGLVGGINTAIIFGPLGALVGALTGKMGIYPRRVFPKEHMRWSLQKAIDTAGVASVVLQESVLSSLVSSTWFCLEPLVDGRLVWSSVSPKASIVVYFSP